MRKQVSVVVLMKARTFTNKQNAGKLQRTVKEELQTLEDFHKDRVKNTIFMAGLRRMGEME